MKKTAKELLQSVSLKVTPARVSIIEMLYQSKYLLSTQDIHELLNKQGSTYNLSTIYRVLESLKDNELINEVTLKTNESKLYEFNHHRHHHFFVCEECHKIEPINTCFIHDIEHELEGKHKFKIKHHNLELYGVCDECDKEKNN